MNIKELRQRYGREPFEPFFLVTESGRRVLVPAPLSMAIAPSGRFVVVAPPEKAYVRLLVEDIERTEAAPGDSQEAA